MQQLNNAIQLDSEGKTKDAIVKYKQAINILKEDYYNSITGSELETRLERVLDLYTKRVHYLISCEPSSPIKNGGGGGVSSSNNNTEVMTTTTSSVTDFTHAIIKDTGVTWDNVIGLGPVKIELRNAIILPLFQPDVIKPYKGVLLYGPPGTGKSLLAKALATESKRTFISVTSSDLIDKYMGESEKRIKSLFITAKQNEPSIIFIDEIDSIGGSRTDNENDSMRRVKTELLTCMDGMFTAGNVIVIGATNTPQILDEALKRRFERQIYIPPPTLDDLTLMIEYFLPGFEDANQVAKQCPRMTTGADIASICKLAKMHVIETIGNKFEINSDGFYIPSENGTIEENDLLKIPKDKLLLRKICKEDLIWALDNRKNV